MKKYISLFLSIFFSCTFLAQEHKKEEIKNSFSTNKDPDLKILDSVTVYSSPLAVRLKMNFYDFFLLKRRIYRTYPYAKKMGEIYKEIIKEEEEIEKKEIKKRNKLKKIKQKRKENQIKLFDEFEENLKRLSKKEGQILSKLINRETGKSVFDLIKKFKNGMTAWIWNRIAILSSSISLEKEYNPNGDPQDYQIEAILKDSEKKDEMSFLEEIFESVEKPTIYKLLEPLMKEKKEKNTFNLFTLEKAFREGEKALRDKIIKSIEGKEIKNDKKLQFILLLEKAFINNDKEMRNRLLEPLLKEKEKKGKPSVLEKAFKKGEKELNHKIIELLLNKDLVRAHKKSKN